MKWHEGHPEKFQKLLEIIKRLRSPGDGCPWDLKQSSRDIGRYLIEEAYEALDALESGSAEDLREELGDLLFQILFLARIEEEEGRFDIGGVLQGIAEKMIRRHPHVFGETTVSGAEEVKANWEKIKSREKEGKAAGKSLLDSVPRSMPALPRAQKLASEAARVGFDWENIEGVLDKLEEEIREFRESLEEGKRGQAGAEIGDILFAAANLARFYGISAEQALAGSNRKFERRFRYIEEKLGEKGRTPGDSSLEEMDSLWNEYKEQIEKGDPS